MAFKTFGVGDVLTSSDVNDYLMEQVIITCTSGTRPSSPNEGMTVYETDTDVIRTYDGSAWRSIASATTWTSYTPTWTASTSNPSLGNGSLAGRYRRLAGDELVIAQILLTVGSTTTFGSGFWRFSLPVTAFSGTAGSTAAAGSAVLIDSSTGEGGYRTGVAWLQSTTTVAVVSATGGVTGTDPIPWANTDQCRLTFHYQPA